MLYQILQPYLNSIFYLMPATLEELLLSSLYELFSRKSSAIFRQPVDIEEEPSYLEVIKKPMDLTTIFKKLKNQEYYQCVDVYKDLKLIVQNCLEYNKDDPIILKILSKFEQCIGTIWNNFLLDIQRQKLEYQKVLCITKDHVKKYFYLVLRSKKKLYRELNQIIGKQSQISTVLEQVKKSIQSFDDQEIPLEQYHFHLNQNMINVQLTTLQSKKIRKYKKNLENNVMWIHENIVKCFLTQSSSLSRLESLRELSSRIEGGQIIQQLDLNGIGLYLTMLAQWMRQYQHLYNRDLKEKFVDCCDRISEDLRYIDSICKCLNKNIKNKLSHFLPTISQNQELLYPKKLVGDTDELIDFINMMERDKDLLPQNGMKWQFKINELGQMEASEFFSRESLADAKKKKRKRKGFQSDDQIEDFKKKKQYQQSDEEFINNYSKKSNIKIVKSFSHRLQIDWDNIYGKSQKIPENFQITWDHNEDEL